MRNIKVACVGEREQTEKETARCFWRLNAKGLMTTKQRTLYFLLLCSLMKRKTTVQPSHDKEERKHTKIKRKKQT